MLDPENQSLKDIVLKNKLCSEAQIKEALEEHDRTGRSLKDILVDFQFATEEQILAAIATSLGVDFVDLRDVEIDPSIIQLMDGDTVRSLGAVPVDFDGITVTVVPRDPLNYEVADEIHFILGKPISIVVALEAEVDALIDKYYPIDLNSMHDMLAEME